MFIVIYSPREEAANSPPEARARILALLNASAAIGVVLGSAFCDLYLSLLMRLLIHFLLMRQVLLHDDHGICRIWTSSHVGYGHHHM